MKRGSGCLGAPQRPTGFGGLGGTPRPRAGVDGQERGQIADKPVGCASKPEGFCRPVWVWSSRIVWQTLFFPWRAQSCGTRGPRARPGAPALQEALGAGAHRCGLWVLMVLSGNGPLYFESRKTILGYVMGVCRGLMFTGCFRNAVASSL